jgi:hypothetical protein
VATQLDVASCTAISNTADVSAATTDPNPCDNQAAAETVVDSTLAFWTVAPCRVVDSRTLPPSILEDGDTYDVAVTGVCGVPANARAVAINVTGIDPQANGRLEVFRTGPEPPTAQRIGVELKDGITRANNGIVLLGPDGSGNGLLSVHADLADADPGDAVDFAIDVVGYFVESPSCPAPISLLPKSCLVAPLPGN